MKKPSAVAAAALAVVALGVGKSAAADQAAAAGVSLQPGQWEMVTQVTSIEIPGAPAEVQAQIRSQAGQSQTNRECMTAERARNPIQEMRETMARGQGANCRFTDEVFGDGVIRIRATCPGLGEAGGGGQMSMDGSFTATTIQATLAISVQGANPAVPGAAGMRMAANVSGRRVGECPATPPPPAPGEPVPESPPPPPPPPSRS